MKKTIFAFLLLIGSASLTVAQEDFNGPCISFQARIKKPITNGNPVPKSPVTIPDVYQDGHTLYIDSIGDDATIELTDENDVVIYSVFVPDGTTTVIIPSTLTGTYGLNLIPDTGDYYFYSEITF